MYKDATDAARSKTSAKSAAGLRVNCRGQRRCVNNYKQVASAFVNKKNEQIYKAGNRKAHSVQAVYQIVND